MNILIIILISLISIITYNFIAIIIIACCEDEEKMGIILSCGVWLAIRYSIFKIYDYINKQFFVKSIIQNKQTNQKYYCNCSNYNDFLFTVGNKTMSSLGGTYKGIKRKCYKKEWKQYPKVTAEMLEEATRNCAYCVHDGKECFSHKPLCKCDDWGYVQEYTHFERKKK